MRIFRIGTALLGALVFASAMNARLDDLVLDYASATDAGLQAEIVAIDVRMRVRFEMTEEQTAVGVLDLKTGRLALVRPDKIDYAASVPKIGILLAWFETQRDAALTVEPAARRELGLMIKISDNATAAKYSQLIGLRRIQDVLDSYHLYDAKRGGGLWVGKHYGKGTERTVDPVGGHSHGATVRQLLRFYLLLEQGKLVSPAASKTMREIFASPEIPHRDDKFVRGLAGRERQILRKAGWWEKWFHDTAIVSGEGRHYIVVAMTQHPRGDDYLTAFAAAVDDVMGVR